MLVWQLCQSKKMILSRRHMNITIAIAILLHGVVVAWFSWSEPMSKPRPMQPLQINLLATIAETSIQTKTEKVKPKPVKPLPAEVKPVKNIPEPEQVAEIVQQVTPAKTSPAIMDRAATIRYEQLLAAWLEKHKKYPARAKRLRIEGEGILRIVIDRTGQTRRVSLEQRTGNRLLDKAALEMVQRANPFPPMPENDTRGKLEFIVPVAFLLR